MYQVTSKDFAVKMDGKEYRSDGKFRAEVDNPHDETDTIDSVHKRQLSPVEAIAIGSCAIVCLLGTAVFVWRFYVSCNNLIFYWWHVWTMWTVRLISTKSLTFWNLLKTTGEEKHF